LAFFSLALMALVIDYHAGGERLSADEVDHYLSIING
jgi:hypothetical protein